MSTSPDERIAALVQNTASQAATNAVLLRRLTAAEAKAQIYEHALRLIADDKTNPEGWATDKQIADYYLQKGSMS